MHIPTLEEVIRQHISLPPRPNGRGFFSILCKVCNDHGKKGRRAGFKFEHGTVGYNCFNCGHSALYTSVHSKMSKDMVTVLDAFEIPKVDWQPVLFASLATQQGGANSGEITNTFVSIEPDTQVLPSFFYPLTSDSNDEWAQCAIEYLTGRHVKWESHPFYLVKRVPTDPDNKRWYGRLIIPVYKDAKLIFWQGRDLTDLHVKKYLSPSFDKDRVLSGYDRIRQHTDEPLYITEGWFDAYHVEGVALFGNRLMEPQIKWINQSHRQKVVIPDRFGDGHLLAQDALAQGWSVSLPDIGSCKDVDAAVSQYGQLYTKTTIRENTCSGFEAEARLGIYCETGHSKKTHKRSSR